MYAYPPAGSVPRYPELERLICAAICNSGIAAQLLSNPLAVLESHQVGQTLSQRERQVVLSIRGAENIHEFAEKLHERLHKETVALRYQ